MFMKYTNVFKIRPWSVHSWRYIQSIKRSINLSGPQICVAHHTNYLLLLSYGADFSVPVGQGWKDLRVAEHALVLAAAAQILPHLVNDTPLPILAPTLPNHAELINNCCGSAPFPVRGTGTD
jgi:hypothetical protein